MASESNMLDIYNLIDFVQRPVQCILLMSVLDRIENTCLPSQTCCCVIDQSQAVQPSNLRGFDHWSSLCISKETRNLYKKNGKVKTFMRFANKLWTDFWKGKTLIWLTEITQSTTGFFSALSEVSFSLVSNMAVTCSMVNTLSSSK